MTAVSTDQVASTDADDAPLIETKKLTRHFRVGRGLLRQQPARGRRRRPHHRPAGDRRARG